MQACMHAIHNHIPLLVDGWWVGGFWATSTSSNGSQHNNKSVNIMAKDTLVIGQAYA